MRSSTLNIELKGRLVTDLTTEARRRRKGKGALAKELIQQSLEDAADHRAAMKVLKKKNPSILLEEVEARLDLGSSRRSRRRVATA